METLDSAPAATEDSYVPASSNYKPSVREEDSNEKYFVTDPTKGKHVSYTVKGCDALGDFDGQRRYKDFLALRSSLVQKWPGCYVPPIPPKKAIGNKDLKFIEERRILLQRFLRELGRFDHLLNSEEFKTFARPSGPDI